MKNISFLITGIHHISGISSATVLLANKLANKTDYNISIITLTDRSDTQFVQLDKKIQLIKVYDKKVNLKLKLPQIIYKVKKIIKNNKIDMIVSPLMIFYIVYFASLNNKKVKLIAWDHASIPIKVKHLSINYYLRKFAVRKSEKLVVITQKAKEVYLNRYNRPSNIIQIYNPVDNFNKIVDLKYNEKSKKIISAGVLESIKGFDMAVDVAFHFLKKYPDWEWHIYGEGKEKERLQKLIVDKQLENQVKLMGFSSNLKELFKEYSFFVLTSRAESFGMVIIEAQESLLPVVSFDSPYGPAELIREGVNGFLIKTFDKKQMAAKIVTLIEDESVRIKMSSQANLLSKKMSVCSISEQWINLINKI